MKTSAQSDAANKNQRLSLFKSSKDHCKITEPKKLATKEKHINQQPASSLSKNANEFDLMDLMMNPVAILMNLTLTIILLKFLSAKERKKSTLTTRINNHMYPQP